MNLPFIPTGERLHSRNVPEVPDEVFTSKRRRGDFRRYSLTIGLATLLASTSCGASSAKAPVTATTHAASPTQTAPAAAATLPARWWQWSESIDPSRNPIDDRTGAACALQQPADIWFLAGTYGGSATRSCSIPARRSIYFPVLNQVCTVPTGTRVESAIARCKVAATTSTATLDGKPLRVNEADSGGAFDLLSKPGSTTLPAGKHSVVAWGLWVGPVALTPGQHTVTLSGRAGSFETSVTYHLSVG